MNSQETTPKKDTTHTSEIKMGGLSSDAATAGKQVSARPPARPADADIDAQRHPEEQVEPETDPAKRDTAKKDSTWRPETAKPVQV